MSRIKGIDIAIILPETTETDPFGAVINVETKKEIVSNVLIAPASSSEIIDSTNLYGKKQFIHLQFRRVIPMTGEILKLNFSAKHGRHLGSR